MPISLINMKQAKAFIREHHYAIETPSSSKVAIGLFDDKLIGVIVYGYGTRPLHTIKLMFPSLDVENYLEINRLCLLDECPRNSESQFIAESIKLIKQYYPKVKVIFSWADGLRGKPGYVYQASNFLYGGYIWSEYYLTKENEVVAPRLLITRYGRRDKEFTQGLGLRKIHGYQFRYIKFICNKNERKIFLKESPFNWNINYPKNKDLKWMIDTENGTQEIHELESLKGSGKFRRPDSKVQMSFI